MPVEKNKTSDVVRYEAPCEYSREAITIASGEGKISVGTVLQKNTSSGKYEKLKYTAVSGEGNNAFAASIGTGAAVAAFDADATDADAKTVAIVRHAIVVGEELIFPDGIDAEAKTEVIGDLESLGIIIRKGVK